MKWFDMDPHLDMDDEGGEDNDYTDAECNDMSTFVTHTHSFTAIETLIATTGDAQLVDNQANMITLPRLRTLCVNDAYSAFSNGPFLPYTAQWETPSRPSIKMSLTPGRDDQTFSRGRVLSLDH
jgi:hypothetical protein